MQKYLTQDHDKFFKILHEAQGKKTLEAVPHFLEVKKLRAEYPEYPYLDNVTDYVAKKLGLKLDSEQRENLKSMCYFAGGEVRKDKEEADKQVMITAGWRVLDKTAVDEAIAQGKKLQVNAVSQNDWMSVKIDNVYKPHIFNRGTSREQYGLMKPKGRSRGYALYQFDKAFCKLV